MVVESIDFEITQPTKGIEIDAEVSNTMVTKFPVMVLQMVL